MDALELNRTINTICAHLPNWFIQGQPQESGNLILANGKITLKTDFKVGQRILLTGGMFAVGSFLIASKLEVDTGGYLYTLDGAEGIDDEIALVYGQRVPPGFIALCEEIAAWRPKNKPTSLQSENIIGEYSYTKATGPDGLPPGWQKVFAPDLREYRTQMTTGVRL